MTFSSLQMRSGRRCEIKRARDEKALVTCDGEELTPEHLSLGKELQ